ncbi:MULTISPECIES: DNA sulfur modification protein DndB [Burkholderia]|uniref:DGQHR domain protein n=1 Tax=Burkholderia cepacia TaxID=292 RepID=A0AA88ZBV7_BURCE|nr:MULTISPECIES: DNA sulfur modification protein DndB [Burkholderia]KGC09058.1 DGQHR domain protein [Burkholderia cepacia]
MSSVIEHLFANNQSTPMDLDDLIAQGGTADKKIGVLVGHNLGSNTLLLNTPMFDFYKVSEVANERALQSRADLGNEEIAQRNLDPKHAQKLAVYLLKGLAHALATKYRREGAELPAALDRIQRTLGKQPYLAIQPITANIRTCDFGGKGLRFEQAGGGLVNVYLANKDVLWVVDGQHRRFAMDMLFDYLRTLTTAHKYPKRPQLFPVEGDGKVDAEELRCWLEIFEIGRTTCSVMVEVHLGLTAEQERQLFHDLNNLTKKVEASLAFQFDQSNPVNLWIKEQLHESGLLSASIVERDVTDWHDDKGYIARKDLIAINAILFTNKTNVSSATPQDVEEKSKVAVEFWSAINEIDGFGQDKAKQRTVAAQPVVLKALAKLVYDFGFGRQKDPELLEKLLAGISRVNFSHEDPMWRYYQLSPEERTKWNLDGLAAYLPSEEGANRDVGAFNEKDRVMRFGAKHNDIYPIIGDMIRWKLNLPTRNKA